MDIIIIIIGLGRRVLLRMLEVSSVMEMIKRIYIIICRFIFCPQRLVLAKLSFTITVRDYSFSTCCPVVKVEVIPIVTLLCYLGLNFLVLSSWNSVSVLTELDIYKRGAALPGFLTVIKLPIGNNTAEQSTLGREHINFSPCSTGWNYQLREETF